jgi:tRNA G10  N-methylase Trm11
MKFLILLAQQHEEFRITELQSLADIYGIKLDLSNYIPEVCLTKVHFEISKGLNFNNPRS